MRKTILAAMFGLFGYFAAEAYGATTLDTTRAAVTEQCGHNHDGSEKSGCNKPCGSSSCQYHCDSSSNCSVTIYRVTVKKPPLSQPVAVAPSKS